MATIPEILNAYGQIGVTRVKQLLETVRATGKTINSVKYEVTNSGTTSKLVIKARPFTSAIETGIRPTTKGVSKEMIDNLTEYAQARGMDNPKSAAWAIAKTIQRDGDKTYKKGGRDVYSSGVIELSEEIKKAVKKEYRIKMTSFIKNTF